MKIYVEPLRLAVSSDREDRIGDIRLRVYQAQLRRCDDRLVLLDAPTSSGKTLAYLVRAIDPGTESRFGTTIVVYPTNALTWDQGLSLYELLTRKLDKRVNLTVESDEGDIRWVVEDRNADIDLYVLNGETLAALSQSTNTSEGAAIIKQLRRNQAGARIILTNPEVLYYMFLFRFAKMEDLRDLVFETRKPNLLVLDEFHLYHGYSLATVTYMLAYIKNLFDQIIFSSATPVELEPIIHENYRKIRAIPAAEGEIIRHPIGLDIQGAKHILASDDILSVKQLIDRYYEGSENKASVVRVLVILSSVMTCLRLQEALEETYQGKVTAIHGLVPPGARPKNRTDFRPIVVGTSAIEVGVDFDASSLIIEAADYSTFIQRLGRGARHNSCCATCFLPEIYLPSIKKRLREGARVTPNELNSAVGESLPDLPSYPNFSMSKQSAPILLAILMNWVRERPAGGGKLNDGGIIGQTTKQLEDGSFEIPDELLALKPELLRICKETPSGDVLTMSRNMSCRSSLESIPSVFTFKGPPQFDQLSLQELPKVYFRTVTKESLMSRGINIPWKMRFRDEFIEVYGTRAEQARPAIDVQAEKFDEAPAPLMKFHILAEDHELEDKLSFVIRKQPAYIMFGKEDWRFPGFFTRDGSFLVVGGDAYLAWFLRSHSSVATQ
jgi:CRISPR-associated helicase Cas3